MWIEYWRFALEKGHKKQPRRNDVCTPSGVAFETKGFSVILTYFNITGGVKRPILFSSPVTICKSKLLF